MSFVAHRFIPQSCGASSLHRDLNARALLWARRHGALHELSTGRVPSVVFGEDEAGWHGNFHPQSYRAILAAPGWKARLSKPHTAGRRAMPRADWRWRELDSAASSDALLMNIFCYPGVLRVPAVAALLGVSGHAAPVFGVRPRLLRERGLVDTTEIDMMLVEPDHPERLILDEPNASVDRAISTQGAAFFESKLTEGDFQVARRALLERFTGWDSIFDTEALPRTAGGSYAGYQLIRGVLAAEAAGGSFCVLCDARRADLVAQWHAILLAVESATLRCRLKLLTWQELAAALPAPLQRFLAEKYGLLHG